MVLSLIGESRLSMTNASLLAPHLTQDNHEELLRGACGKTKFEVEKLIASQFPKPEVEPSIRRLPDPAAFAGERTVAPPPIAAKRPSVIQPVSATRNKFVFCGDDELVAMYQTLQGRLRHRIPFAKLEDVVREAFKVLMEKTDPTREPKPTTARSIAKHTRYIPRAVRREVWRRDGSQCGFESQSGRRCGSLAFLELDHLIPWSLGGSSQDPNNLAVRCRAHNQMRGGASSPKVGPTGARTFMGDS